MPIQTKLVDQHGRTLNSDRYFGPPLPIDKDLQILVTGTPAQFHGAFKSATRVDGGTTTIVTPNSNGSLLITDIVISGEKTTGTTTTINFTDGVATVQLYKVDQANGPVNISTGFVGRVQGWTDARIDMVTDGTNETNVLLCYMKLPEGLPFAEWDALR